MNSINAFRIAAGAMFAAVLLLPPVLVAQNRPSITGWQPLFNGVNLDGWSIHLRDRARNDDPDHLVQTHDGLLHFYKDARDGTAQPFGYVATDKEYENYRLRLEFKWGENRFAPRANTKRDSGLLYHVTGTDKVWPDSVEFQIQEGDVGDIYAISTRVTSPVAPKSTNSIITVQTNRSSGVVRTNRSVRPEFLAPGDGGVEFTQGRVGASLRIMRHPRNERTEWNTLEVEVRGDSATHIVNGKRNNQASQIKQDRNGQWTPLNKGRIALQLEGAEVLFRNIEIQELKD